VAATSSPNGGGDPSAVYAAELGRWGSGPQQVEAWGMPWWWWHAQGPGLMVAVAQACRAQSGLPGPSGGWTWHGSGASSYSTTLVVDGGGRTWSIYGRGSSAFSCRGACTLERRLQRLVIGSLAAWAARRLAMSFFALVRLARR
jgi:hypothetical protein